MAALIRCTGARSVCLPWRNRQLRGIISDLWYPVTLTNPSEAKTIGLSAFLITKVSLPIQTTFYAIGTSYTYDGSVKQKQSPRPWYSLRSPPNAFTALIDILYLTKRGYMSVSTMFSMWYCASWKIASICGSVDLKWTLMSDTTWFMIGCGRPIWLVAFADMKEWYISAVVFARSFRSLLYLSICARSSQQCVLTQE